MIKGVMLIKGDKKWCRVAINEDRQQIVGELQRIQEMLAIR